jgi:hypothetical protein
MGWTRSRLQRPHRSGHNRSPQERSADDLLWPVLDDGDSSRSGVSSASRKRFSSTARPTSVSSSGGHHGAWTSGPVWPIATIRRVSPSGAAPKTSTGPFCDNHAGTCVRCPKNPDRVKHVSAHELRRAFGVRWAARLMPAQLMELMRHESIDTTLRYYVGADAQRTAEAAWAAYEQAALAVFSGRLPNSSPNSGPAEPLATDDPAERKSLCEQALPSNGAAGTRTQDQRIKSPMLYRLSYSPGTILPKPPAGATATPRKCPREDLNLHPVTWTRT